MFLFRLLSAQCLLLYSKTLRTLRSFLPVCCWQWSYANFSALSQPCDSLLYLDHLRTTKMQAGQDGNISLASKPISIQSHRFRELYFSFFSPVLVFWTSFSPSYHASSAFMEDFGAFFFLPEVCNSKARLPQASTFVFKLLPWKIPFAFKTKQHSFSSLNIWMVWLTFTLQRPVKKCWVQRYTDEWIHIYIWLYTS